MKFWELLSSAKPRDPATGRITKARSATEERILALAKATDYLSPGAKEVATLLAKSNLTTEQAELLVSQHKQRDDILKGYRAILEAARLRNGTRAKALLKRKGEL